MIKHHDNKAEINERKHGNNPPEAPHWVEEIKVMWLQVIKGAQEEAAADNGSPPVFFLLNYKFTY